MSKTKTCARCRCEQSVMYRVQYNPG